MMKQINLCFIALPADFTKEQANVAIFIVDGIPVSYSVGYAPNESLEDINITSDLGHVKKLIFAGMADQLCIHPIDSSDPAFIEQKIKERYAQVKALSMEKNETIAYMPLITDESLCISFYKALGLADADGKPVKGIEPTTLSSLGLSVKPPFMEVDVRKLH
ncbi:hypothetical protein [Photobacterium damselae]|uniref:hypothetical protein n=1 Tax=Photobacterium damselae TaxID=38293 RepID=UPI0040679AE2